MATVYLAADLRHERSVAIKVLKPEVAQAIGADRFLSEIKTTARLQHPHILPLHDSGDAGGFLFYVMPHVEGESLRARLEREGQLPVEDAVLIARRVAEALDHAHRHGVVHRDIKPGNILLAEGEPLVADFGIAMAMDSVGDQRLTETGLSIGSPHYMSPEQASADRRIGPTSDVFSLGCVTYEMLVGAPPFDGKTPQSTVLKILTEEVGSVSEERKSVPPNVAAAVAKALEKVPADRFQHAADMAQALADPGFRLPADAAAGPVGARTRRWALVAAAAVLAIPMAFWAGRALADGGEPVLRLALDLPRGQALVGETGARVDVSADGLTFVYVGEGEGDVYSRLWIRDLRRQGATPLEGTDDAFAPSLSPDGSRVAFRRGNAFYVVDRNGGPPILLADGVDDGAYNINWGADGFLYFGGRGVFRVPEGGGEVEHVVPQDDERRLHFGPRVLPNGRGVVFALGQNETRSDNVIAVADLASREMEVLTGGVSATYAPSGHLLIVRADGQLDAAPFNQRRLEITGPTRTLGTGVGIGDYGGVDMAISESGTLMYTTGAQEPRRRVVFVDEGGFEKPLEEGWEGPWESVVLSPDERQLLVGTGFGVTPNLWVRNLADGQMRRLTMEGDLNRRPVWSRDGRYVTFISQRGAYRAVYRKRADGVGSAELLLELPEHIDEVDWSWDEEWLVYRTGMTGGDGRDIHAWHVGADSAQIAVAADPGFDEMGPTLSPDGRWLAYVSMESGVMQVYVRSFPDPNRLRVQVSVDEGRNAVWSEDGRTLFYREGTGAEMHVAAVSVEAGSSFSIGERRRLFSAVPYRVTNSTTAFDFRDADGTFVMIREDDSVTQGDLVLVRNFFADPSLAGGA